MQELAKQATEAAAIVKQHWADQPCLGIILGSGHGEVADEIRVAAKIDYADLPHFPHPSAIGHAGQLICGQLEGQPVIAFQGRFHLYEGYSAQTASLPVRLLKALGGQTLVVTNAAGGVNPAFAVGDLMLIDDQINLMFDNPLIGVNEDHLGPRFPDMSAPFDAKLGEQAISLARQHDFALHRGVYLALRGPTYETRAEYRMARRLGADAVGMSTVPEVIAAVHAGIRALGLTTITNIGSPDTPNSTSGHEVINAAALASPKIKTLVRGIIKAL